MRVHACTSVLLPRPYRSPLSPASPTPRPRCVGVSYPLVTHVTQAWALGAGHSERTAEESHAEREMGSSAGRDKVRTLVQGCRVADHARKRQVPAGERLITTDEVRELARQQGFRCVCVG